MLHCARSRFPWIPNPQLSLCTNLGTGNHGLVPYAAETGGANGVAWAVSAITGERIDNAGLSNFPLSDHAIVRSTVFWALIALCIEVALPVMIRVLFELNTPMTFGLLCLK